MTITLTRLTEVPIEQVAALLNEPRNARHMPLAGRFDLAQARDWVVAKDAQWAEHGYGPWAVLVDGGFAGWAGFQREDDGADLGVVLLPEHRGQGLAVTRAVLLRGFGELGLTDVLVMLPLTRHADGVVARLGFAPDGLVQYAGVPFHRYRLTRERWSALG